MSSKKTSNRAHCSRATALRNGAVLSFVMSAKRTTAGSVNNRTPVLILLTAVAIILSFCYQKSFRNRFKQDTSEIRTNFANGMASDDIERIDVAATYSEVVIYGPTVYLSGQIPENAGGMDIKKQTEDVLTIIEQRLATAGSDKSRILTATIYLTNLDRDYSSMNEVWNKWVPSGTAPARTTVGVAALASSKWSLEITVTAARK